MLAAKKGHEEVVALLLEHGDTAMSTKYGMTAYAFGMKSKRKKQRILNPLKKSRDENMFQKADWSYFPVVQEEVVTNISKWDRVKHGMVDKSISYAYGFKFLISYKGFKVNAVDDYGRSILMFAAYFGYFGIALTLLRNGADVTLLDGDGMFALTWGTNRGRVDFVESLIKYRTSMNSPDWLRRTPLHHALRARRFRLAKLRTNFDGRLSANVQLEVFWPMRLFMGMNLSSSMCFT